MCEYTMLGSSYADPEEFAEKYPVHECKSCGKELYSDYELENHICGESE